jgi:3-deoxy-manno-octulosonate cytidylyltransferase (CMP-KDO synthetase)
LLQQFDEASVQVASMMQAISRLDDIMDPNFVKVAVDKNNNSLFLVAR